MFIAFYRLLVFLFLVYDPEAFSDFPEVKFVGQHRQSFGYGVSEHRKLPSWMVAKMDDFTPRGELAIFTRAN